MLHILPTLYSADLTIDTSTAGTPVCADVAYAATEFDVLIGALENTSPLPPRNTGSDAGVSRATPERDDSITVDTADNMCYYKRCYH